MLLDRVRQLDERLELDRGRVEVAQPVLHETGQLADRRRVGKRLADRAQGAQRVAVATPREGVRRREQLLVEKGAPPPAEAQHLGLDVGRSLAPAPDRFGPGAGGPARRRGRRRLGLALADHAQRRTARRGAAARAGRPAASVDLPRPAVHRVRTRRGAVLPDGPNPAAPTVPGGRSPAPSTRPGPRVTCRRARARHLHRTRPGSDSRRAARSGARRSPGAVPARASRSVPPAPRRRCGCRPLRAVLRLDPRPEDPGVRRARPDARLRSARRCPRPSSAGPSRPGPAAGAPREPLGGARNHSSSRIRSSRIRSSGDHSCEELGRARVVRRRPGRPSAERTGGSATDAHGGSRRRLNATKRPGPGRAEALRIENPGGDLLSQGVSPQVPSARAVFTAVFGMGTGVSPPLLPPETCCQSRHLDPRSRARELQSEHEH